MVNVPSTMMQEGWTALIAAADTGQYFDLKYLLAAGANTETKTYKASRG